MLESNTMNVGLIFIVHKDLVEQMRKYQTLTKFALGQRMQTILKRGHKTTK